MIPGALLVRACLPDGVLEILSGLLRRVSATECPELPGTAAAVDVGPMFRLARTCEKRVRVKIEEAANCVETRPGRTERPVMEKVAMTAVVIALLTAPAHSQTMQQRQEERGKNVTKTPMQIQEEERAQRALQADRDYDAAMKRSKATTPSTATPSTAPDPWQNVRPDPSTAKKPN